MTNKQFAALAGFATVAVWSGLGLGTAIACLLVGGLGWLAVGVANGEIDLGEMQDRVTGSGDTPS